MISTNPLRMLGQFEHLAESYFSGHSFDLGERQLDRILSVEHDLDSFVAAIGLSKYELETAVRDDGWCFIGCEDLALLTSNSQRNYPGRGGSRYSVATPRAYGCCSGGY